jgi:RNA polymerase sigma-70 factor (ECF subfamily)
MQEQELARLYQDHGWHVFRRSLRILGDEEEARDVCQEVFLRLAQSDQGLASTTAWIFRVTTNLCLDHFRARRRRKPQHAVTTARDPQEQQVQRDLVLKMLDRASDEEQSLAILRYVDELTLEEMEQVCGLTRKTISKKLDRFMKRSNKIARGQMRIGRSERSE